MKKTVLSAVLGLCAAASAALPKPTDHWGFDDPCAPMDPLPQFRSVQNPQRGAVLDPRFVAGVPGAVGQGLWCPPGVRGTLASAVIVPAKGDFTFSFFAGFPEAPKGGLNLFHNPKMSVALTADGRFAAQLGADRVEARESVADGRWHHFAVVRRGPALELWTDGRRSAVNQSVSATVFDDIKTQWAMLDESNAGRVFLDEVKVWRKAFGTAEFGEVMAEAQGMGTAPHVSADLEDAARKVHYAANPPFAADSDYTPLRIEDGGLRPFAEQHDVNAVPVPWTDPAGRDLVCFGSIFGSHPLLYRFLRLEDGVPVYAQGEPWRGADPRTAVAWRGTPGEVAFVNREERTPPGGAKKAVLVLRRGDPATGAFDAGRVLQSTAGGDFAFSGTHWSFSDMDGDGVDDLVAAFNIGDGNPNGGFPWKGANPWTDDETPYAGLGRGYDIFGRWMGREVVSEVKWAKGEVGADGLPRFAPFRPVLMDVPDYPGVRRALTWKIFMGIQGAAAVETSAGRQLVLFGDMLKLVSLPLRMRDGDVFCGEPVPLLASGYEAPHGYWIHHLLPVDVDGDGRKELLLDGNPGTVAVLKGDAPGTWTSNRAWIQGGAVCGETLSSAARVDWDGDGLQDLVLADASGWMTFWRGTKDPLVYGAPKPFTVDGRPFCRKGGPSGSLQGEVERVWGYVKVIAGQWGDRQVLVTVDIRGDLLLHARAGREDPLALKPAQPFRRADGRPFKVAWRSRPSFAKPGFAGVPRQSLLLQDVDGDVAVAVPDREGSLTLSEVRKLAYADGKPIRLSGINGLSGRCHLQLIDWDGDGDEDIAFGNNGSCQRFFAGDRRWNSCSSPFLLRNVGTRAAPAYARAELITLKRDGLRLFCGWHNATPWATDLDGDGREDLLVSAENGKVYAFRRTDLND